MLYYKNINIWKCLFIFLLKDVTASNLQNSKHQSRTTARRTGIYLHIPNAMHAWMHWRFNRHLDGASHATHNGRLPLQHACRSLTSNVTLHNAINIYVILRKYWLISRIFCSAHVVTAAEELAYFHYYYIYANATPVISRSHSDILISVRLL
jgi:hypothetical protein